MKSYQQIAGDGTTDRATPAPASPAHTPEPWRSSFATVRKGNTPLAECHNDHPLLPGEANAARICAAVNACAGMTDPEAEIKALRDALEAAIDIMEGREAGSERVDALSQARAALSAFGGEAGK